VLFSLRPLSVEELLHALEINDHQQDVDGKTRGFQEEAIPAIGTHVAVKLVALLENCGSLLEIRKTESLSQGDWKVQFIHFSTKEYLLNLQSESLLQFSFSHREENHAALTNTCLLYLIIAGVDCERRARYSSPVERDNEMEVHERKWGFYSYARRHWGRHFRLCGNEVLPSYAMRRKIFLDSSPTFDSWKLSLTWNSSPLRGLRQHSDQEAIIEWTVGSVDNVSSWYSRVLVSCMFGMLDILRELLAEAKERTPPDALPMAVYCGQAAVVEMLIQRDDVDVNYRLKAEDTLLFRAHESGWKDITRLLLGRPELRVNEKFNPGGRGFESWYSLLGGPQPVLFYALDVNDEAFVRQLLERDDLDVNCIGTDSSGDDMTPLSFTITQRKLRPFKLLLARKGVDVNLAPGDNGRTPLHIALGQSLGEFIQLLLARDDILVNKPDDRGRTPLDMVDRWTNSKEFQWVRDKGGKRAREIALEAKTSTGSTRSPPPPRLSFPASSTQIQRDATSAPGEDGLR
jgi:hypothetical protein